MRGTIADQLLETYPPFTAIEYLEEVKDVLRSPQYWSQSHNFADKDNNKIMIKEINLRGIDIHKDYGDAHWTECDFVAKLENDTVIETQGIKSCLYGAFQIVDMMYIERDDTTYEPYTDTDVANVKTKIAAADTIERILLKTKNMHSIPLYNDDPETTYQDIINLIDDAIKTLKEKK